MVLLEQQEQQTLEAVVVEEHKVDKVLTEVQELLYFVCLTKIIQAQQQEVQQ